MTKPQLLMELTTLYTIFDQNEWDYLLTEPKTLNLLAGNELDVQVCTEPSDLGLRTRSSLFIIVRPGSNRQRVFIHLNGLVVSRLHGVNFNLGIPILTSIILPLVQTLKFFSPIFSVRFQHFGVHYQASPENYNYSPINLKVSAKCPIIFINKQF